MNNRFAKRILILICFLFQELTYARSDYASYVDPFIGTDGWGACYPGVTLPFGMVQFSPDVAPAENRSQLKKSNWGSNDLINWGTQYAYDSYDANGNCYLDGFSLTHFSGSLPLFGNVFLTPTSGSLKITPADYGSPFDHRRETASPGYYQVFLDRFGINAELTATIRGGVIRFTFPKEQPANVLVPIMHTLTRPRASQIKIVGNQEIEGQITSSTLDDRDDPRAAITVYFCMQFEKPFSVSGTWKKDEDHPGGKEEKSTDDQIPIGAYVTYPASTKEQIVQVRIGISYVDVEGARKNLQEELNAWDFEKVRAEARKEWENELGKIEIDPRSAGGSRLAEASGGARVGEAREGSKEDLTMFYTALYHSFVAPNIFSDVDGRYRGFDQKIHQTNPEHPIYATFSGWDIYQTQFPLLCLLQPQRVEDMCQSIVKMYQEGGWIDRWPQANTYSSVMVGSPLTVMLCTAWNAGLHGFDMETAYQGMWKDATESPPPGSLCRGQDAIDDINRLGYVPYDRSDINWDPGVPFDGVAYTNVSQLQEASIAYASLSYLAKMLGKESDAKLMVERCLKYRNLWDQETHFFRPKSRDGKWLSPFDGNHFTSYAEGSAMQYRWRLPQNIDDLICLMGGKIPFVKYLEEFFDTGQYVCDNEIDLHCPFLFNYVGLPWKTQERVRKLLCSVYRPTPRGIPSMDDGGALSSWYIFSALGLYPVDPTSGIFLLTSPLFPKAILHLQKPHKTESFVIEALNTSIQNLYIQEATLNGQPLHKAWIFQDQLTSSKSLTFKLADQPNPKWASQPEDMPPSLTTSKYDATSLSACLFQLEPEISYINGEMIVKGRLCDFENNPIPDASLQFFAQASGEVGQFSENVNTGMVPEGAFKAILGLRVNRETHDYGPSDLLVNSIRYHETEKTENQVPNFQFRDHLKGWKQGGTGKLLLESSDKGSSLMLHITASSKESLFLDSAEFPVTAGASYTAAFPCNSTSVYTNSGVIIFLDSNGTEIGRRIFSITLPSWNGEVKTDKRGAFKFFLKNLQPCKVDLELNYPGDSKHWSANYRKGSGKRLQGNPWE